jgi:hypothetical protein
MKCVGCDIDYPSHVVVSNFITNQGVIRDLCGCCALEAMNFFHKMNRKHFDKGTAAENARLDAVKYRKTVKANQEELNRKFKLLIN